jgi:thiol-disulfide isomerase/thioredoxin/Spy/CpxP family protein refolding chaperone
MKRMFIFSLLVLTASFLACQSDSSESFVSRYQEPVTDALKRGDKIRTQEENQLYLRQTRELFQQMKTDFNADLNSDALQLYARLAYRVESYLEAGRVYKELANRADSGKADTLRIRAASSYVFGGRPIEAKPLLTSSLDYPGLEVDKDYLSKLVGEALYRKRGRDAAVRFLSRAREKLSGQTIRIDSRLRSFELVGEPAPGLNTVDTWINSGPVTLNPRNGNPVVLEFWAPWCGTCQAALPKVKALHEDYAASGVRIMALTRLYGSYRDDQIQVGSVPPSRERQHIKEFVDRHDIDYTVGIAESKQPYQSYGVSSIPTFYLIDGNGRVADVWFGSKDDIFRQIRLRLNDMLQGEF